MIQPLAFHYRHSIVWDMMRTPDGVPILKHLLAFHMVVILAHKPFSLLTYSKSLSIWAYCMLLRSSQSSWALRAEKQGSKKKPFPTGSAEIKLRALHMQGKDSNTTTSTSLAKKCVYMYCECVCVCLYRGIHTYSMCIYMYICNLFELLKSCRLGSPTMTASCWKGQESGSCSFY